MLFTSFIIFTLDGSIFLCEQRVGKCIIHHSFTLSDGENAGVLILLAATVKDNNSFIINKCIK